MNISGTIVFRAVYMEYIRNDGRLVTWARFADGTEETTMYSKETTDKLLTIKFE